MSETKKVPEIRFEGFTDDWGQRKLSEVLVSYTDPVDVPHDGYERLGIRSHAKGTFHNYVPAGHELQTAQMHRVAANKFIVNITFGWEHAVAVTDEKDAGKLVSHRFPQYSLSEELDPKFLKFIILDESFRHHLWLASPGGAGRNRVLNLTEMLQYEIQIPKVSEQRKIANALIKLDNIITLHQCKYEKLKTMKKTMLEKMFPKNDEDVPEIRFEGFEEPWEKRKVGDYYDFKNGLNKGKEYFGTGTPIVNFTDVFNNRGIYPETLKGKVLLGPLELKSFEVKKGDIFFTRTSETIEEIGYPSVMLESPKNTVFSGFVLRGRCVLVDDPLDNLFKKYVFFTDVFRSEMLKKSSMTTRALTSGTAIKNMEFRYPSNKAEQHQIGVYLTHLDNLITLHQRKYEKLKQIKQSMLQKMFV